MIVNRRFVELYLQGRAALGTHVRIGGRDPNAPPYTIVGVVNNVKHNGLTREVKAQFYAPQPQFATNPGITSRTMTLVVRGSVDAGAAGEPRALGGEGARPATADLGACGR